MTKINRVLKFKQSDWMKIYIDFKNAANSLKFFFFKLMINSVYGKTMENSVKIVNNEKDFLKHVSKPTFIKWKIFDNCYAAIHEIKTVLTLKKPIYVRFTVLELSKLLMYDFH